MLHVQSCYKNSRIFFEFVAVVHVFMCGGPLRYENYRVTVNEVSTLVQESFFVLFNRFSLDIVVAVAVVGASLEHSLSDRLVGGLSFFHFGSACKI